MKVWSSLVIKWWDRNPEGASSLHFSRNEWIISRLGWEIRNLNKSGTISHNSADYESIQYRLSQTLSLTWTCLAMNIKSIIVENVRTVVECYDKLTSLNWVGENFTAESINYTTCYSLSSWMKADMNKNW